VLAELASLLCPSAGEQLRRRVACWHFLHTYRIVETGSDTNELFHSIYEL